VFEREVFWASKERAKEIVVWPELVGQRPSFSESWRNVREEAGSRGAAFEQRRLEMRTKLKSQIVGEKKKSFGRSKEEELRRQSTCANGYFVEAPGGCAWRQRGIISAKSRKARDVIRSEPTRKAGRSLPVRLLFRVLQSKRSLVGA
jgi:hypothetical protein